MEKLTTKQALVMDFLREHVVREGYPPTMREIGTRFGFAFPAAKGHLRALERKGHIRLVPGKSRGIEIVDLYPPEALALPLAGDIRAGEPILAHEDISARIFVDRTLFKGEGSFALRVKGDSMMDAGILEGDYVIVRPQSAIESGQIGVALIGGDEATVKTVILNPADETVTLVPHNSSMEPRTYPATDVAIIGKVTGVIRKL